MNTLGHSKRMSENPQPASAHTMASTTNGTSTPARNSRFVTPMNRHSTTANAGTGSGPSAAMRSRFTYTTIIITNAPTMNPSRKSNSSSPLCGADGLRSTTSSMPQRHEKPAEATGNIVRTLAFFRFRSTLSMAPSHHETDIPPLATHGCTEPRTTLLLRASDSLLACVPHPVRARISALYPLNRARPASFAPFRNSVGCRWCRTPACGRSTRRRTWGTATLRARGRPGPAPPRAPGRHGRPLPRR